MKNSRMIGGIFLALLAAGIFIFNNNPYSTPATITLLIIGISLIATGRRAQEG